MTNLFDHFLKSIRHLDPKIVEAVRQLGEAARDISDTHGHLASMTDDEVRHKEGLVSVDAEEIRDLCRAWDVLSEKMP